MLFEIVTFSLVVATLVWLFIKRKYSYWEGRGIDSVPAIFPYGSLKQCLLLKKNIGEVLADFYRQYNDKKFVGFYAPFDAMLLIRDPELIRTVLVKDFNSFGDTGFSARKDIDPLLAYNPFGEKGLERWKASRNVSSPALAVSKLKIMATDMIKATENFTKFIETKIGEPLEIKTLSRFYLVDAVLSSGFGVESNSFCDKTNTFREFTKGEMFVESSEANYASLSGMFMPFACRIFRWRTLSKDLEKLFRDLSKSCTEHRKKNGIIRPDFLQQLITINSRAEQENRKPLSEIELATHCVSLFGDGVDTSGAVLAAAFYFIASHSAVQEKLRAELKSSLQDIKDLDFDKLHAFDYLDMTLSEIFRLHPPVPLLSRTCIRTTNLDELKIYSGTKVFIPTMGLHMDPKYYPEPEKFIPERFSKEKRADLHKFAFLPFGEGPRMCLGFRFGQTEVKIALVAALLKFRMTLATKKTHLETDAGSSFLLVPKGDIDIIFTPL